MSKSEIDGSFTVKSGPFTVRSRADVMEYDLDPPAVGKPIADEIVSAIERGIATNPQRTRDGKRRLFVRTGNLARSMEAVAAKSGFHIVAPPGYLEDDAMMERLAEAVPVIDNPLTDKAVERAINEAAQPTIRRRRR